jgi:hypothetical protein
MIDIVYHYAKAFKRPHAQKRHVAVFRKYYFVNCGVAFGGEYGLANVALNYLLVCHS